MRVAIEMFSKRWAPSPAAGELLDYYRAKLVPMRGIGLLQGL
jgi:hypothetical protein